MSQTGATGQKAVNGKWEGPEPPLLSGPIVVLSGPTLVSLIGNRWQRLDIRQKALAAPLGKLVCAVFI